jgi:uncharacterized protein (TIGR02118 family)
MHKIVSLVRRASGLGTDAFRARYLEQLAKLDVRRCIASVVDVPPAESGLDPVATPAPAWDAVVETWHETLGEERDWLRSDRLTADVFSWAVHEVVQKERPRTWPLGQRSPGIKGIYPVMRRSGMTADEFAHHWREVHGPLALAHHVGMCAYVQNIVIRPLDPAAPSFDGFSALHFPSARDLRERFIDSREGARRIADDVAKFVGESLRLDASEYVLRDGSG